jgi:hypothetical protein
MPIGFELAPANVPEREVAAEILRRFEPEHYTVICDKGVSGEELEELVRSLGGRLVRPDRKDEGPRFGCVRQWIESIIDTLKGQLSLERHGGPNTARSRGPGRAAAAGAWRLRLAQLADRRAGLPPHWL